MGADRYIVVALEDGHVVGNGVDIRMYGVRTGRIVRTERYPERIRNEYVGSGIRNGPVVPDKDCSSAEFIRNLVRYPGIELGDKSVRPVVLFVGRVVEHILCRPCTVSVCVSIHELVAEHELMVVPDVPVYPRQGVYRPVGYLVRRVCFSGAGYAVIGFIVLHHSIGYGAVEYVPEVLAVVPDIFKQCDPVV